jgi:hypothetical protein
MNFFLLSHTTKKGRMFEKGKGRLIMIKKLKEKLKLYWNGLLRNKKMA